MSFRPAGMSSESSEGEFDDDDGFSTPDKVHRKKVSPRYGGSKSHIKSNNNNVNSQTSSDEQDLHFRALTACMTGDVTVIDEFLDSGHNVNDFLNTGWTLLLYASSAVLPEVIEHLLKRGANPNKHKDGYTPLMAVCDSTVGTTERYLKCVSILLEAKGDPNATNKDRKTALMFACKSGEPDLVQEMLKYVRNVDAVDNDGRSAIFHAVIAHNPQIVKILMASRPSTIIKDRRDLTIKDIAVTKGYDDILELLNFEEEEIESFCPVTKVTEWKDAFPGIKPTDSDSINIDVAAVLYGLGLDKYRPIFKGMELKQFLQLTEEDLIKLGMDIQLHRKQFLNGLLKFHGKKWSHLSLGTLNKALPYTLYDGMVSLGNVARQIGVIGSSFCFIKDNLLKMGKANEPLSEVQTRAYKDELKKTEKTLGLLKQDLHQMLTFAKKIEKESTVPLPPAYIGPEKKRKMQWPIVLGAAVMIGFYLSKTTQLRLWN